MNDEPELRCDPVTGRWALVAPKRALRPIALPGHEPRARTNGERRPCPFCPGEEHDTPNEVFAIRDPGTAPNGPGWRLRVVPNKFPAVRPDVLGPTSPPLVLQEPTPPDPPSLKGRGEKELPWSFSPLPFSEGRSGGVGSLEAGGSLSLFQSAPATGFAEVLIDCPEHLDNPALLSDEQFRDVFCAYRERVIALSADPRLAHVAVFKNVGVEAGASLGHTHSQIIALSVVPDLIRAELSGSEAYHTRTGRCVFCAIVEEELTSGARLVARSEQFAVVTAFAPRFAYEMWVLPVRHEPRYESISDEAALELARLLKRVLGALDEAQHAPAYNWFLHSAPVHAGEPPYYHWHLELLPRTARPAGLEWGYGCHITTVAPERAAAELRARLAEP
jgi:UDPglucose--hexose-1-phosphate uridylyltransferase